MNFSSENIKSLVESMIPFIKKISKTATEDCVKCKKAQIVSMDAEKFVCTVKLPDSDNTFTVPNVYGFDVSKDQYVDLYYVDSIVNAYIGNAFSSSSLEQEEPQAITAESIGAIPAPTEPSSGDMLLYDGEKWSSNHTVDLLRSFPIGSNSSVASNSLYALYSGKNISDYSFILIEFRYSLSDKTVTSCIIKTKPAGETSAQLEETNHKYMVCASTLSSTIINKRYVYFPSNTSIKFSDGYTGTTQDNSVCLPAFVYGIR